VAVRKGLPNLFGSIPTRSCLPMSFGKRAVALGERGRQWAGVEDARHAAGPRWAPRSSSRRRDSPIRLDGKYFCHLAVSGVKRQTPAAPRTDGHPLVIDTAILLTFVAINPFAVESISLADDINQNNRPDFDLVPCLVPLLSGESRGFGGTSDLLNY
jgi:hypothetical protein